MVVLLRLIICYFCYSLFVRFVFIRFVCLWYMVDFEIRVWIVLLEVGKVLFENVDLYVVLFDLSL